MLTASHPWVALYPGVPHPGLFPVVISLNIPGLAYRLPCISWMIIHLSDRSYNGLRKPRGGRPAAASLSLRMPIIDAKIGADADVPSIVTKRL